MNHLVACSGCGYSFWTTEDAEEWLPHCRYGRWMIDREALNVPVGGYLEQPNQSSERRELVKDWV